MTFILTPDDSGCEFSIAGEFSLWLQGLVRMISASAAAGGRPARKADVRAAFSLH
jgi:hypothetical protein